MERVLALLLVAACATPQPAEESSAQTNTAPVQAASAAPSTDAAPSIIPVGEQIALRVVKSPTCGCCSAWVDYMKANGFAVTVEDKDEFTALKRANGITPELESCHTAFAGDLVIEGHVPADLVKKLLRDTPAGVHGVAVPGMPIGSPGMEGGTPQRYTVYTFDAKGSAAVYSKQ